ncbi:cell division protein FtsQ [Keratinibaculum paraultunense]|uniref:Cell division protein FtsQ n=1 Tax=Keratinibaculum paraultunense TaxID=1278232 RepID=A0A4R3L3R2_9FIRM|nr:FtsQ-type POTRA domain-containing protein [Keratinibaculum paraultunense]QQY80540.1 FtsQ-type POTRA domain-containing protein [Keratinibaculum paraultunense]TCS91263.1 cell division protein FtsQ [Keratinibaculum paraultunense]
MKKNKKHRGKKRRKIFLKFILFILTLGLIYLFVFDTNFFNIEKIQIVGNGKMSYSEILNASTYTKGENIFKISKKLGEENLKKLPYIKEAKVKRKLPKTLLIQVEEREEVAIVPYIGAFVYIDEEGNVLSIKEKKAQSKLPQIFGIELIDVIPGENLFSDDRQAHKEFLKLSKQMDLLKLMKYINFSDNDNINIELISGIKVAFGPLDNVKYKLSFLYEILKDLDKKDITAKQILLNKGENPVVIIDD